MIRRLVTSPGDWFTRLSEQGPPDSPVDVHGPGSRDDLHGRLRRGGLWVIAGRASAIGLTVVFNVLLARVLSPHDFGAFVLVCSMISMASTVAMFGLNGAIVPLVSRDIARMNLPAVRRVLRYTALAALVSGCAVALLTPWAVKLVAFDLPRSAALPWLIAACALLMAWQQVGAEALRGFHDQRWANVLSGGQLGGPLTMALFLLLFAASVAGNPPSLTGLTATILAALGCTVLWTLACVIRAQPRASRDCRPASSAAKTSCMAEILHLCVPMFLIQVFVFAAAQADLWIAGYYITDSELAVYASARRLILLAAIPAQIASATVAPSIAALHIQARLPDLGRMLRSAAGWASLPALGALAVFAVAGGPLLRLLFGPEYAAGAPLALILGLGQLTFNWCGSCGMTLTMTGHQKGVLLATILTSTSLLVAGPVFTARWGVAGLAWSATLCLVLQSLTLWLLARWRLGIWTHASFGWMLTAWRRSGSVVPALSLEGRSPESSSQEPSEESEELTRA